MTIDEKSNFLLSGGDSLKALHLCEDILATVGVTSPELLEVVLDGTFSDIVHHVARATGMPEHEDGPSTLPQAKRRHADSTSVVLAKRVRKDSAERPPVQDQAVKVLRRGGEVTEMNSGHAEDDDILQSEIPGEKEFHGDADVGLSVSWFSDTGRCVDASPVLLIQNRTDRRSDVSETVFIGSHSHRIQALDITTGNLLWERVLGGRIEASAAVSHCGTLVVLGLCQRCEYLI